VCRKASVLPSITRNLFGTTWAKEKNENMMTRRSLSNKRNWEINNAGATRKKMKDKKKEREISVPRR